MPYVPAISNYHPFYFQTDTDASAWDTREYGLVAQVQPFPDNYEVKEPYKNDWFDENGDDEYAAQMFRKAFEYTIRFYIKAYPESGSTAIGVINSLRDAFREKIRQGEFKVWDSYHERGFQKVRLVSDKVEEREIEEGYAWMIFSVTLKVNDPSTRMTLSGGRIVTA